jgi:hypothetical protein
MTNERAGSNFPGCVDGDQVLIRLCNAALVVTDNMHYDLAIWGCLQSLDWV